MKRLRLERKVVDGLLVIASWRFVLVCAWSGEAVAEAVAVVAVAVAVEAFLEESWQIGGVDRSEQVIATNNGVQPIEKSVYGKASLLMVYSGSVDNKYMKPYCGSLMNMIQYYL